MIQYNEYLVDTFLYFDPRLQKRHIRTVIGKEKRGATGSFILIVKRTSPSSTQSSGLLQIKERKKINWSRNRRRRGIARTATEKCDMKKRNYDFVHLSLLPISM